MRRLATPDWDVIGWHYKGIHRLRGMHNRMLPVRARGMEHTPTSQGFLWAANHGSWWDPIILQMAVGRPVNWLAKRELRDSNRFNKWFFFDRGGCIAVDRFAAKGGNAEGGEGNGAPQAGTGDAFAAAVQALEDDRIIGIFPEGTRNRGELGPAKTGVARLALQSGKPIVPTAILTDRFWPRDRKTPRFGEPIYLNVGEPRTYTGDPQDPNVARKITDELMGAIADLVREAKRAREAEEKWPAP